MISINIGLKFASVREIIRRRPDKNTNETHGCSPIYRVVGPRDSGVLSQRCSEWK